MIKKMAALAAVLSLGMASAAFAQDAGGGAAGGAGNGAGGGAGMNNAPAPQGSAPGVTAPAGGDQSGRSVGTDTGNGANSGAAPNNGAGANNPAGGANGQPSSKY